MFFINCFSLIGNIIILVKDPNTLEITLIQSLVDDERGYGTFPHA